MPCMRHADRTVCAVRSPSSLLDSRLGDHLAGDFILVKGRLGGRRGHFESSELGVGERRERGAGGDEARSGGVEASGCPQGSKSEESETTPEHAVIARRISDATRQSLTRCLLPCAAWSLWSWILSTRLGTRLIDFCSNFDVYIAMLRNIAFSLSRNVPDFHSA